LDLAGVENGWIDGHIQTSMDTSEAMWSSVFCPWTLVVVGSWKADLPMGRQLLFLLSQSCPND